MPPTRPARKTPQWGSQAVLIGAVAFLGLGLVSMAVYSSRQDREINRLEVDVFDLQKQTVTLNRLVIDLSGRLEAIERGPRVVPTQVVQPAKPDETTRREVAEVKAAVQEQGQKLDAVLDGLRNVRGRRR